MQSVWTGEQLSENVFEDAGIDGKTFWYTDFDSVNYTSLIDILLTAIS